MEARTESSLPTGLLAIELSKASWIVAVHTPLSEKISRYTLQGCDWKSLLELIERIRKRASLARQWQSKTDRIDAARLLRSLMAHARGEPKAWSVVRVPSAAEEDDRRLHRERDRLIHERGQRVNRIKGLCATGDQLPRRLKEEIKRELRRLEIVLQMSKGWMCGRRRSWLKNAAVKIGPILLGALCPRTVCMGTLVQD